MPKKKKNHFVSRGIIQFWANQNGQVAYWDKSSGGRFVRRNPTSVHKIDFLYAKWEVSGTRDMHAEDALAKEIDDLAPTYVKNLLNDFPNSLSVSTKQRAFWTRFVLRTISRNPAVLDHLLRTWTGIWLKVLFRLLRWMDRGRKPDIAYKERGKKRVVDGDVISALVTHNIDLHVREFSKMRFSWVIPQVGAPNFVLGTQPYFIKPSMRATDRARSRQEDAFCGVVIHPRIMLSLFDDNEEDEMVSANVEDVQRINGLFAKYSSAIVAADAHDLDGAWFRPYGHDESDKIKVLEIQPLTSNQHQDLF